MADLRRMLDRAAAGYTPPADMLERTLARARQRERRKRIRAAALALIIAVGGLGGVMVAFRLEAAPPATSLTPTSSTTPIRVVPPWASAGSVIYKCGDALCVMRPDGSGEHDLLPSGHPWPQWDAAVSPNGKMVAFRGY